MSEVNYDLMAYTAELRKEVSDLRNALAKVRDNEASAIVALTKASARADAAEDTAASAFDGMRVAKNRAEAAEAALEKERAISEGRLKVLNEKSVEVRGESARAENAEAQVAALTEKLEAAKRLTAPHLQEYALRLEDENKALTEKVAGMTAAFSKLYDKHNCRTMADPTLCEVCKMWRTEFKDAAPILAKFSKEGA